MDFRELIARERICLLDCTTKKEAIDTLLECFAADQPGCDIEAIREAIYYRESLMSTGIGLGIGIPHIRTEEVQTPTITIGVAPGKIADYGTMDNQAVDLILMIIAGKDQHKQHIQILAQIVNFLKTPGIREKILAATDAATVYQAIKE